MTRTLIALSLVAAGLTGCAESHYLPAPDGGMSADDAAPAEDQCVRWDHPDGYPEDVRCIEWADAADAGPQGCAIAPFYGPGDPSGACAR